MKFLSRDFTQKERILLIVLAVLLLVVFYYYVVDIPLRDQQAELEARKSSVETELTIAKAKVAEYDKMAKDLKKMNGDASKMESYNNRTNEINFLNDLLANTSSYSINFEPVTVDKNQVRREFQLAYTCGSYDEAIAILEKLSKCKYRRLISDVGCASVNTNTAITGAVNVTVNATFYETLVGKTTDAGLPEIEEQVTDEALDEAAQQ